MLKEAFYHGKHLSIVNGHRVPPESADGENTLHLNKVPRLYLTQLIPLNFKTGNSKVFTEMK